MRGKKMAYRYGVQKAGIQLRTLYYGDRNLNACKENN